MGANETPSEPDPSACFRAFTVLDRMLRDIEAGKEGAVETTRKENRGGSNQTEKRT